MAGRLDEQSLRRIARMVIEQERALRNPLPTAAAGEPANQTWWPFRNDYAGEVPSYGVIAITGITKPSGTMLPVYTADRPSATFQTRFAVNGPRPVPSGGRGVCCLRGPCTIAHDSSWSPAAGDVGGPKPGSFLLFENYPATTIVDGVIDADKDWLLGSLDPITHMIGETTGAISEDALSTSYSLHYGRSSDRDDAGYMTVPSAEFTIEMVDEQPIKLTCPNGLWLAEPLKCEAYPA